MTKDELNELFCMEVDGLTLKSFFQGKEKCVTLKCIEYNERKKQFIPMPPIPVLILIGLVLLLLMIMVMQEVCRIACQGKPTI